MHYNFGRVHQMLRVTLALKADSPTMSGPSKESSPSSGEPESLAVYVDRLRQQAEEFQRTVEVEIRTTQARIEDLLVSQAKRRRHGRRVD